MNAYKNVSYVGFVLMLISVVLFGYSASLYMDKIHMDKNGIVVKGKIIEIMRDYSYRRPMVQFKTKDGQLVTFVSQLFTSQDLFKYKKGQQVDVIYDPKAPSKTAEINAFFERNTAYLWTAIVGLIVFLTGIGVRKGFLKKAKRWEAQQKGEAPPIDYRKQGNRAAWIAFGAIILIIMIFVIVLGVWGNKGIWNG